MSVTLSYASRLFGFGKTPFACLACCLVLGLAAAQVIPAYCFSGLAAATAAFLGAAWLALSGRRPGVSLALALGAVSMAGLLLGLARRDAHPRDHVLSLLARDRVPLSEAIQLDGCVAMETQQRGTDAVTIVDLRGLRLGEEWIPCRGKASLRLAADTSSPEQAFPAASLHYGDRIRGWVRLDVPRNFQNPGAVDYAGSQRRRGIYLTARARSPRLLEVLPRDCGTSWGRLASAARLHVRSRLEALRRNGNRREASVLACILLGDDGWLDTDTREAFQNAGTYHVLVVSGLHVAWIAWALLRVLHAARLPAVPSRLLASAGVLFYAQLVGMQASITRCLYMFALYLIGQAICRRTVPSNIVLAAGFLLLGIFPDWIRDTGFQLSFGAVLGIVLTGAPVIERFLNPMFRPVRHAGDAEHLSVETGLCSRLGRRWRARIEITAEGAGDRFGEPVEIALIRCAKLVARIALYAGAMIWISISVQLWLALLLAHYFNRLSWIVPAANLLVVPLASATLLGGLLASFAGAVIPHADWAYGATAWVAALLWDITARLAGVTGAWQRCPTPGSAWIYGAILLLFVWSLSQWRRKWIPWLFVAAQLAVLACPSLLQVPGRWLKPTPTENCSGALGFPRSLRMAFLDVGQGDAAVVQLPDARVWVIDAGNAPVDTPDGETAGGLDIGEAVVSRYLWTEWITGLDRVFLSHPHRDHAGGLDALLRNVRTARFCFAAAHVGAGVQPVTELAAKMRIQSQPLAAGRAEKGTELNVQVLHPPADWNTASLNESSLVLRIQYGRFTALLPGDLEGRGEAEVLAQAACLEGLLLKVPHHGSRTAATLPFLQSVRPRWAVISAGRNNPFGNPSPETLLRLIKAGARPLLTQDHGTIFFETDGRSYTLSSYRGGLLEKGTLPP